MNKDKIIRNTIIGIFVALYFCVSIISTIHVIDFFALTNPRWLAISLALAFELGAAASLAAIIILAKTSRSLVWFLFILLTAMQMMGNMFFAYTHANDYTSWMELFGLNEEEPIYQKRILAIISGAILPIVALGFIKSLVDYIRPETKGDIQSIEKVPEKEITNVIEEVKIDLKDNNVDKPHVEEKIEEKITEVNNNFIENKTEELDEEALFAEDIIENKNEINPIETTKNENMTETLGKVEEMSRNEDAIQSIGDTSILNLNKPEADAKLQVIKDIRNEEEKNVESSNKWPGQGKKFVSEEAGTGGQKTRTFGPPHVNNNGLI